MDLFVDLKVPAVGGSQWTTAERQREEKSLYGNDLQTLLDFCGSPQNDAVERVKGIEPSYEAWEAAVLPLNYTRVGADSSVSPSGYPATVIRRGRSHGDSTAPDRLPSADRPAPRMGWILVANNGLEV